MRKKGGLLLGIVLILLGVGRAFAQTNENPRIVSFDLVETAVSRERLEASTQYVHVAWEVINRSETTTLIFEQFLPDNTWVNIEQARPFEWVNSKDKGIVVPLDPGDSVNYIVLTLRVVDKITGNMLAVDVEVLPIVSEADYQALSIALNGPSSETAPTPYMLRSTPVPTDTHVNDVQIPGFHIYNEFPTLQDTVLLAWNVVYASEVCVNGICYAPYGFPENVSTGGYTGGAVVPVSELVDTPGEHPIQMTAHGINGSEATASFVLNVRSEPLPSQPHAGVLAFTITPTTVSFTETVTLSWSVSNAAQVAVGSYFVENPNGYIHTITIDQPIPVGSLIVPVSELVDGPGNYWINLEAIANQPGWANGGWSTPLWVTQ